MDEPDIKKQHEREAARVNLRKMLDGKKRGDRITAADVVEATGFSYTEFRSTIHSWARGSGYVLSPVKGDGWRIGTAGDHIDFADGQRRSALRRDERGLKALMDTPRAELDESQGRRSEFLIVRAASRVQQARAHQKEVSKEFKLSERVPLRALSGGK